MRSWPDTEVRRMVLETLEAAKALMGDISASAERRAEILLKNAELDADRIVREAKESSERLHDENTGLRNRLNVFRTRYRTLLESELEKFDTLSSELFADKEMDDLKSILEDRAAKPSVKNEDEDRVDFTVDAFQLRAEAIVKMIFCLAILSFLLRIRSPSSLYGRMEVNQTIP